VCPFNRTGAPPEPGTRAFAPDARWSAHDAAAFLDMDDATFARVALGSPIQRAGAEGMARNAALVLGNAGDRRHLPVLARARTEHRSPVVRDAAASAHAALVSRLGALPDRGDDPKP